MSKKNICILSGVIILILIAVIIITVYLVKKSVYDFDVYNVDEIKYSVYEKDGNVGVIDFEGNILVEAKYKFVNIINPEIDVFVCTIYEDGEYFNIVLNKNNEEIFNEYDISCLHLKYAKDNILYENTVLIYTDNEKKGLIDINEKIITDAIYDEISPVENKEGFVYVSLDGKKGVLNIKGQEVVEIKYGEITTDLYEDNQYFKTGYIVSNVEEGNTLYGYVNYKGKELLDVSYSKIERIIDIYNDNIYLICDKDGKVGLIKNTSVVVDFEYESLKYNRYNNVMLSQKNEKYGVVSVIGKIQIDNIYDNLVFGGELLRAFTDDNYIVVDIYGNETENQDIIQKYKTIDNNQYIIVNSDDIYMITNKNGDVIIDKSYTFIEELCENKYKIIINEKSGVINLDGEAVIDVKYEYIVNIDGTNIYKAKIIDSEYITYFNNEMIEITTVSSHNIEVNTEYINIYDENDNMYFDLNGNILDYSKVFKDNGIYAKKIEEKWGFVDSKDNIVVDAIYEMVTQINIEGFAGIKLDGKWGVINSKGEIIIEPILELNFNPYFINSFYKNYINTLEPNYKNI